MTNIKSIYNSWYQEENPEKFNEELIYYKNKENILKFIEGICKSLEIIPAITFLGCSIESIRNIYKETDKPTEIEIENSLLQKIVMEFRINKKDENGKDVDKVIRPEMYFPILVDNHFFILNGKSFVPIYQLVNSATYRMRNMLVLRNLILPIIMEDKTIDIEDCEQTEFKSKTLNLNIFKSKVNLYMYYFAKMGYEKTLEYFELESYVQLVNLGEDEEFNPNMLNFKVSKSIGFNVDKEYFSDKNNRMLVVTLISLFSSRMRFDKIKDQDYWLKQLGSNFTKNKSSTHAAEKGTNILMSFERILDNITKDILRIPDSDKEDTYAVVRWMAKNYISLSKLDNMDLNNKRLRLYEFLTYPLLRKFSRGVNRILNKKNPSYNEIRSIFNIPSGSLVSYIIKNEVIRYNNSVNSFELFNLALKATMSGPQSQFSNKSDNISHRRIHPSYMGKIDLVSTSAGDPGVSFVLSPFLELEENLHFSKSFNFNEEDNETDEF